MASGWELGETDRFVAGGWHSQLREQHYQRQGGRKQQCLVRFSSFLGVWEDGGGRCGEVNPGKETWGHVVAKS